MKIKFSMDGIKNMDLLYTWNYVHDAALGEVKEEHYHGTEYCKEVIKDILSALSNWNEQKYLGQRERIANETFVLTDDDKDYSIAFEINTYDGIAARIVCTLIVPETEVYDNKLEKLKIALKNRLIQDWRECTWLIDEQSENLCVNAYQRAYHVENNLRAFASKVLIHFLGIRWIECAGFDKYEKSVKELETAFTQRVPEFDDINTDFISMTLETLVEIMFEGIVYEDSVVLTRQQYNQIQDMGMNNKIKASNISEFVKARCVISKNIWKDLFVQFIDNQDDFKRAAHDFISGRNHVAHSKVLS